MRPINERIKHTTGLDLDLLLLNASRASEAFHKQRAVVEFLEEQRKIVLAGCIEKERAMQQGLTVAQYENLGRLSAKYRDHIVTLRDAKIVLGELAAEYYGAKNAFELARSQLAFVREEMKL